MRVEAASLAAVEPLLPRLRSDGMGIDPGAGSWFACREGDRILGVSRLTIADGFPTVDDIWVLPEHRRRGVASALLAHARGTHSPIWLICDEDMIGFYERRGFTPVPLEDLPVPLAALYASRGEWPRASDHDHFAMRSAN